MGPLLALLLACGPAEGPGGAATPEDTAAAQPTLSPAWSAEQAAEALSTLAAEGLPEPFQLHARFLDILALSVGEGTCPSITREDEWSAFSVWAGACEFERGEIEGLWLYEEEIAAIEGGQRHYWDALLSFTGTWADGVAFEYGGGFTVTAVTMEGRAAVDLAASVYGLMEDADAPGWISERVDAGLAYAGRYEDGGWTGILDGTLGREDKNAWFDALRFDPALCGDAPTGRIEVRDPSTGWWTFEYPADCSGCAEIGFAGEVLGTSCERLDLYPAVVAAVSLLESTCTSC